MDVYVFFKGEQYSYIVNRGGFVIPIEVKSTVSGLPTAYLITLIIISKMFLWLNLSCELIILYLSKRF
ncbi:hypothetical protein RN001_007643 [Aquatica leii]|uniref:Uncharacterized protein n=1 Tax=Aquatica leii TaxID=1421715 RepID=A0AAN7SFK2_9COLE|nr:hypothetical protein RN001_007643 [Aquatica leii]